MKTFNNPQELIDFISKPETLVWFLPLMLLILALKLISLWKSARGSQKAWFIILGIVNTFGILEIVYLIFFTPKTDEKVQ